MWCNSSFFALSIMVFNEISAPISLNTWRAKLTRLIVQDSTSVVLSKHAKPIPIKYSKVKLQFRLGFIGHLPCDILGVISRTSRARGARL